MIPSLQHLNTSTLTLNNYLFRVLVFLITCIPCAAQTTKINGTCIFNPPLANARVQLYLVEGKDTVDGSTSELQNKIYYYKFNQEVKKGGPIYIKGVVTNSTDYKQDIPAGRTPKWINNPHKIYFLKKDDIYFNHFNRATDAIQAKDFRKAYSELSYISSNRDELDLNNAQLLETYHSLGALAQNSRDYEKQLAFLDSASLLVNIDELKKSQVDRLAREKFNAFLKANNYNSRNSPLVDLSKDILEDPEKLERWNKLIEENGKFYGIEPSDSASVETIKDQMLKLDGALNGVSNK